MEIPEELKKLYRHWEIHVVPRETPLALGDIIKDNVLLKDISWFVKERIQIWGKKVVGEQAPYTHDPVLSTYRFCNIFREFDRQTIEFHARLNPLRDDFQLWLLNMFYFRMVARTSTVDEAGLLSFNKENNKKVYEKLVNSGRPRFGTPYVFPVSTILKSSTPTRELFITEHLPGIMELIAMEIERWNKKSVYDGVLKILPIFGFNLHFLWTEVLIDVAYQYPERIDLFKKFPIGPGSLPTLKRIDSLRDGALLVEELARTSLETGLLFDGKKLILSAENWEGIGCEFRKYTNLKTGKGRKRIFSKLTIMR